MSGIIGLFFRNGQLIPHGALEIMAGRIAHRGSSSPSLWSNGQVGLGNLFLQATHRNELGTSPVSDKTGQLVMVADARLDNREDLLRELEMDGLSPEPDDIQLILGAYQIWGEKAADRLLGDFAYAIWDNREKKLVCARDHMGLKPYYYYCSETVFVFASEIGALKCLPFVPLCVNEAMIALHIIKHQNDKTSTFYQNIYRLPPAHTLVVGMDRMTQRQYWCLDPGRELISLPDEQYVESFRTTFIDSVKCRLPRTGPVGCSLSGGLDSSSITCAARQLLHEEGGGPLHTISFIFPSLPEKQLKYIDERMYMNAVIEMGGLEPHFIEADKLGPLSDLGDSYRPGDQPHPGFNMYLHVAAFQLEQKLGVNIHLDGIDGDTTVSYGLDYLTDLVKGVRIGELVRQARLAGQINRCSWKRIILEYGFKPLIPGFFHTLWRKLLHRPARDKISSTGINPSFARRIGLEEMIQDNQTIWRKTARDFHFEALNSPVMTNVIEGGELSASQYGIEMRLPFFDKRLIETSYYMPARLKLNNGWTRWILRKSMEGVLPPAVQWRTGKAHLSPNFRMRLHDHERSLIESTILQDRNDLEGYYDMKLLRDATQHVLDHPIPGRKESELVCIAVLLELWLRNCLNPL